MKPEVARGNVLSRLKLVVSFLPAAELQPVTWRLAESWVPQNSREVDATEMDQVRGLSFLAPAGKLLGCHHSAGHYLSEVIVIVERQGQWIVASIAMHLRPSSPDVNVSFLARSG